MDTKAAKEIKDMLVGLAGSVTRLEEGQKSLRQEFADSMTKIEKRFEKDEAEIHELHTKLAHLTSVVEGLQGTRWGMEDANMEDDAPRRKRGRSADPDRSKKKAAQMIWLSGYKNNLSRDDRKDDIVKHYKAIMGTQEFPKDVEVRVYGKYGRESNLFFASSEEATFFFRKATQTSDAHPMFGDVKLYWGRCKEGRALARHIGTSKAFRAFHDCGAAGKLENDKGKGEIYINTITVAKIILDDAEKPQMRFCDADIAENMKINQEAIKSTFAKLLSAKE